MSGTAGPTVWENRDPANSEKISPWLFISHGLSSCYMNEAPCYVNRDIHIILVIRRGRMRFRMGETNIICTDLERSLHFYRDLLGFEALEPEGPAWHLECDGPSGISASNPSRSR